MSVDKLASEYALGSESFHHKELRFDSQLS